MVESPEPSAPEQASLEQLDRLVDGMADRIATRIETHSTRRRLGALGGAAAAAAAIAAALVLYLMTLGPVGPTPSASIRTALDDEVAPTVDGSRVLRLSYVMEETGERIPYAVYLPAGYDDERTWPLLVGLQGNGLPYDFLMGFRGMLDAADRHGYVLATPLGYVRGANYGRSGIPEVDRRAERDLFNVVSTVQSTYTIDPERTYLWGHSAGAVAALDFATRDTELWNGHVALLALPDDVSGTVPGDRDARGLRVLVFLGADDTQGQARAAAARMREAGLDAEYLELPEGDHFLWMTNDRIDPLFKFFNGERVGETRP